MISNRHLLETVIAGAPRTIRYLIYKEGLYFPRLGVITPASGVPQTPNDLAAVFRQHKLLYP